MVRVGHFLFALAAVAHEPAFWHEGWGGWRERKLLSEWESMLCGVLEARDPLDEKRLGGVDRRSVQCDRMGCSLVLALCEIDMYVPAWGSLHEYMAAGFMFLPPPARQRPQLPRIAPHANT